MTLFQAEKLIDLACSTTHEEEARTAALAACRLIRKHGIRLTTEAAREPVTRSRARAAAPEPVREKPPNGGSFGRASRRSRCESCRGEIALGDEIYVVAGVTWCGRH